MGMNVQKALDMKVQRDHELRTWMDYNNIGKFPMKGVDFADVAHLFKFLTEQNNLVCLLFSQLDASTGKENKCMVLRAGRIHVFESKEHALISVAGALCY